MRKVIVTEKDGLWKVEVKGGYFTKRDLAMIGRALAVEAKLSNKGLKVEEVKTAGKVTLPRETKETSNVAG